MRDLLYSILETTDKFRKEIDESKNIDLFNDFKRIKRHNKIRLKLKDLHEKKHE